MRPVRPPAPVSRSSAASPPSRVGSFSFIAVCGSIRRARSSWPHAREQAGGERDADRVENQTPVVLRVEQDGPPAHRKESGQALESDVRDDQSRRGAEHEEHERFGQHLPEEPARARAGGQPKRELARSHRPAYEQQPSEVRARGQQENRCHQRHHIQRTGETRSQSIQSPRCRCQLDAIELRPRARGGASAVGPERLDTRVGLRRSLPDLDARSQTCHRIEPLRVGVADHGWFERDGQGDIHLTSRLEAMESWRRDADDRKRAIAECQRAADRAGGAAEPALPVSVTITATGGSSLSSPVVIRRPAAGVTPSTWK